MIETKCPHCRSNISVVKKMFLGPLVTKDCGSCGNKYGISYASLMSLIPFILALGLTDEVISDKTLKVLVIFLSILLMFTIHGKFPLIKK